MIKVFLDGLGRQWTALDSSKVAHHSCVLDGLDDLDGGFFFQKKDSIEHDLGGPTAHVLCA